MNLKIKEINVNDIEKVAVLFNKYRVFYSQKSDLSLAQNFIKERLENNQSVIYCIEDENGDYLGFTQLYPSFSSVSAKKSWILNDLFVDENHRRKGVAKMLMQRAKQLAIQTKSKGIFLQTAFDNKKAQSLYEELGYEKDEEFYSYFLSV